MFYNNNITCLAPINIEICGLVVAFNCSCNGGKTRWEQNYRYELPWSCKFGGQVLNDFKFTFGSHISTRICWSSNIFSTFTLFRLALEVALRSPDVKQCMHVKSMRRQARGGKLTCMPSRVCSSSLSLLSSLLSPLSLALDSHVH